MPLAPDYEHEAYNGTLYADFGNDTGLMANETDGAHGGMPTYAQVSYLINCYYTSDDAFSEEYRS